MPHKRHRLEQSDYNDREDEDDHVSVFQHVI